jgi:hypothetical protein
MFETLSSGEASVFEFEVAKVDEQTDFDSRGVEIVDDLRRLLSWQIGWASDGSPVWSSTVNLDRVGVIASPPCGK